MKNCCLFLTLLICIDASAQIIVAPDLSDRMPHQKTMAILPALSPFLPKQVKHLSAERIDEIRDSAGLAFQMLTYRWFATQAYGNMLEVQDPETTDSLLRIAGLSVKDVIFGEKPNVARILGVDVVMLATLRTRSAETSVGYAFGTGPGAGMTVNTRPAAFFLSAQLIDGTDGEQLWEYDGIRDGGPVLKIANEKSIVRVWKAAYKRYPYIR